MALYGMRPLSELVIVYLLDVGHLDPGFIFYFLA